MIQLSQIVPQDPFSETNIYKGLHPGTEGTWKWNKKFGQITFIASFQCINDFTPNIMLTLSIC